VRQRARRRAGAPAARPQPGHTAPACVPRRQEETRRQRGRPLARALVAAGQKHIRPYWKNYYQNTDAIVYMIDSADTRRTDEAAEELSALLAEEDLAGVPVLVYANKQDLLNAMQASEVMKELDITGEKGRWIHVHGCSAKTGEGLEDGLAKLMEHKKEKA